MTKKLFRLDKGRKFPLLFGSIWCDQGEWHACKVQATSKHRIIAGPYTSPRDAKKAADAIHSLVPSLVAFTRRAGRCGAWYNEVHVLVFGTYIYVGKFSSPEDAEKALRAFRA